ncbi:hypothetical protein FM115_10150 [Marinilactibacillus psychrotolerans 42ea]|uniref:Uncharacterized protein n=1 Tax=Marinilactibacillus psychrotolerans 42ea TaxID=1255609 RepID=A0A1R4KHK2_9LACT|nr:hypothetical protein FM115_10150 [Marinilactibacillus psychrotolerans 42ea]
MIQKKRGTFMNYDQLPSEYLDDLLVSLAHHSSGIEGNTITLERLH